jgi:hypothetical protein
MAKKKEIRKPGSRLPVFSRVLEEENQHHTTRRALFVQLEKLLRRTVVTCFTSFRYRVQLDDSDADMLEEALRHTDLSRGLAVIISSPGGDGLATQRIIKLCRSLSGTGEYWAIVPARAMSAATLLCFGASKILMSPSSQLGPVDPQIIIGNGDHTSQFSAHDLVTSYKDLFDGAVNCKGRIEPFVQQLDKYDAREIRACTGFIALSRRISVETLKSGMMKNASESTIEKRIQPFLDPELSLSHGKPMFLEDAAACGLRIAKVDTRSETWNIVYELFLRTNHLVSTRVAKCIETTDTSFFAPAPRSGPQGK